MVLTGATLWGLSGTAAQVLFHHDHIPVGWLVSVRMLVSGAVLSIWSALQTPSQTARLFKDRGAWIEILAFAVLGLVGVQLTYFHAIADGNAASATLLQYLGPPMIVGLVAINDRRSPGGPSLAAMGLSVAGTLLLVTGGHLYRLAVPPRAMVWGILSAIALAFYTLEPLRLIRRYGATIILGWGMLLGGLAASILSPAWIIPPQLNTGDAVLLTAFVVLFGTLAAFTLYLASLHSLTPSETSLMATAEPVAAVTASMLFLHVHLDPYQIVGAAAIVLAIIRLSWQKNSR